MTSSSFSSRSSSHSHNECQAKQTSKRNRSTNSNSTTRLRPPRSVQLPGRLIRVLRRTLGAILAAAKVRDGEVGFAACVKGEEGYKGKEEDEDEDEGVRRG